MFINENIFIKAKKNYHKYYFIFFIFIILEISLFHSYYTLKNYIILNSNNYRAGSFAFNANGDMIIEYSYNNSRLFYGLKKKWKRIF